MATATGKQLSPFGQQLRPILDERKLSVRRLGRMLNEERPEQGRRDLIRWMYVGKGHYQPSQTNRDRVADALEVERSTFDVAEDDEEAAELVLALMDSLQRVI